MYLEEIRLNWPQLISSFVGLGLGIALVHYTMSMFGPPLIAEFGWTKAQFALIGSFPLLTIFFVPVAGRFTDRFGPWFAAAIGFTAISLGFLGFSLMNGSLTQFMAIYFAQYVFGVFTTSLVFGRVIVERFDAARGLALSFVMMGPPLAAAILAPLLDEAIQNYGWRSAFQLLAILSLAGGILALLLMGPRSRTAIAVQAATAKMTLRQILRLIRNRAYLLIVGGMFLVNLPGVIASSQLKLVFMDKGVSDGAATWMVSLYAIGVLAGRFACGLALDRIRPHVVALVALSLPALGLLVTASPIDIGWILAGAVLLIGLAQGAEGDVGAFLVSRRFDIRNYSLLLSGVTAMIIAGSAVGSLLLSLTLTLTGSYKIFLIFGALATVIGAMLIFLIGENTDPQPGAEVREAVLEHEAVSPEHTELS